MLITISREFGAGGSTIAAAVGKRLGWQVIDNEVVDAVAKRSGLTTEEVRLREERAPTIMERVARAIALSIPALLGADGTAEPAEAQEANIKRITEQVVKELIRDHAVLVGRAAIVVVPPEQRALHVRLVASVAFRTKVVAERQKISLADAEQVVKDTDAHRAGYHRQYYMRDWADPVNYHLTLNTEKLGIERVVEMIVAGVQGEERGARSEEREHGR